MDHSQVSAEFIQVKRKELLRKEEESYENARIHLAQTQAQRRVEMARQALIEEGRRAKRQAAAEDAEKEKALNAARSAREQAVREAAVAKREAAVALEKAKREAAVAKREAAVALKRDKEERKKREMRFSKKMANAEGVGDGPTYKTNPADRAARQAKKSSQEAASSTNPPVSESENCFPEIDSGRLCPEASPSSGTPQSVSGDDNVETNSRVG